MSEIFGIDVAQGGATALLVLVVVLILTGRLVPRSVLKDTQDDRDYWRSAHGEEVKARQAERELTNELIEVAHTADQVLTALPRPPSMKEVTAAHGMDPSTE
ncbi:hypothetical protein ACH5A3_21555 [Streptomyces echinatus]|uniref:hypothetical protein n=1 Tax=Streptomyces echinatus TaxID=67293 RepID=UPI00379E975D